MLERGRVARAGGSSGRGVQQLKMALSQQSRLRDEHEAAKDSRDELTVGAALGVADDEVAARERWLRSVDDYDYRRAQGRASSYAGQRGNLSGEGHAAASPILRRRTRVAQVISGRRLM